MKYGLHVAVQTGGCTEYRGTSRVLENVTIALHFTSTQMAP